MESVGVATAKFILFGEHFVVYDGLGMAAPIRELTCVATLAHTDTPGIKAKSHFTAIDERHYTPEELQSMERKLQTVCYELAEELGVVEPALNINVHSTIPIGQGLGSSAALGVALLRAFGKYYELNLSLSFMQYYAMWLEKKFHKKASGIDHLTILNEYPIFFSKSSSFLPLLYELPYTFVIGTTGKRENLTKAVYQIEAMQGQDEFKKLYDEADWLVSRALIAFESNDRGLVGRLMSRNHQLLQKLGVSTNPIDELVEAALAKGALGAKLTGAGCGGAVIALVKEEDAEGIAEIWKELGAQNVNTIVMPPSRFSG